MGILLYEVMQQGECQKKDLMRNQVFKSFNIVDDIGNFDIFYKITASKSPRDLRKLVFPNRTFYCAGIGIDMHVLVLKVLCYL